MFSSSDHSRAAGYVAAILAPILTAGTMAATWPVFASEPVVPYLVGVIISSSIGGLRPGFLSLLFSLLISNFIFIKPYFSLSVNETDDIVRLVIVAPLGTLVVVVCALLRRERARAEQSLASVRQSEKRFRTALENLLEGCQILDWNWRVLYINDVAAKQADASRADLIGKSLEEIVPGIESTYLFAVLRRCMAEREYAKLETEFVRKDGRVRWFHLAIQPVPEGLFILSLDITDRKTAAVEEREARFQLLFKSIPQPLWVYDLESLRFVHVNRAAMVQYGYSRDEFLSMTIKDIRSSEDVPLLLENLKSNRAGEKGVWKHLTKDGKVLEVEMSTSDLEFEGRPSRLALLIDVTERRRAERALFQSEERYRDMVENAHDIIYSHDLQGNFTSVNEAFERITGYSRDEARRMNIADAIAPEFVAKTRQMLARNIRSLDAAAYHIVILAKDGTRIDLEVNTMVIQHEGVPVGVQGIGRDITHRRQLEEQLLQSQKLESLGRLAGGIAHDFNNMLTAINGYSDLTLRQLSPDDPLRRNIEEIKKAGERSAMLTYQLLAFSRRQILHPEVVDLNDVIADTAQMLQMVIGEDVKLATELHRVAGLVKIDRGQVSQIIMNLAVNARDAMPSGGSLSIVTSNFFVTPEFAKRYAGLLPGAYVKVAVTDTGTGMSEHTRRHLFEPFFTTKGVGKGTGLGLSTVYGIVKQSGGTIIVKTETGVGTTFELLLPRVGEERQIPKIRTAVDTQLAAGLETLLLVEDEEIVRSLLRDALEGCGYRVIEAADGATALEICKSLPDKIDLLITDVVMPQMSGPELASAIKEFIPHLPVLFISGYTDDEVMLGDGGAGVVSFLQKPFTVEIASKRVRELLETRKAV